MRTNLGHLIEADVAFHAALHRLYGNTAIVETVADQWPHFRWSMRQVLAGAEVSRRIWEEHRAIHGAVIAGRVAEAGRLSRAHAARAAEDTTQRAEAVTAPD